MTHQQVLHELGLLVLGGASIHFLQAAPLQEPIKRLVSVGVGIVTVLLMAKVAGVV